MHINILIVSGTQERRGESLEGQTGGAERHRPSEAITHRAERADPTELLVDALRASQLTVIGYAS